MAPVVRPALLGLLLLAPPALGQDPGAPPTGTKRDGTAAAPSGDGADQTPEVGERFFSLSRSWSMELPDGWRQLAPAEAHELRASLHPDMLDPQPLRRYTLGQVDRWMAADGGFDGVALVVEEHGDELPHDESLPKMIRDHWEAQNQEGSITHEVLETRSVEIGKEAYVALEVLRRVEFPDLPPSLCLDLYVPTDGKELMFSFRAPPEVAEARQAEYRRWIATASFARPSRGQPSLGQRLFWPLVLGGGVALAMIFTHRASRQQREREMLRGPGGPGPRP